MTVLIFFLDSGSTMYLHELLTGSEVYVEPLKLPEKVCANLFDVNICFMSKARIREFPDIKCSNQTKHETVNE